MANDAPPSLQLPNRSTSEWYLVRYDDGTEVWVKAADLATAPARFAAVAKARYW